MPVTAIPADFDFDFVALNGNRYIVTVKFSDELPGVFVSGGPSSILFYRRARSAGHPLADALPRCRVEVCVHGDGLISYRSGTTLADQLYVALQKAAQDDAARAECGRPARSRKQIKPGQNQEVWSPTANPSS